MSSIIEGNKRDPMFDLTKGDAVEIYLWSRHVTEQIAGTTIVTRTYPCQSASGDASRPAGVDLPVNHAEPSDDSRLKYFKSV